MTGTHVSSGGSNRRMLALGAILTILCASTFSHAQETDARAQAEEPGSPESQIHAVGSAAHLWFSATRAGDDGEQGASNLRIFHHAVDMGGPYFRTPVSIPEPPVAMAASEDNAWFVYIGGSGSPEVYSLRAFRNPATGLYFHHPPMGLELVSRLPVKGEVIDMAASHGDLAVLVRETDDAGHRQLRLFQGFRTWQEIELLDTAGEVELTHVCMQGNQGSMVIFGRTPPEHTLRAFEQQADGWATHELSINATDVLDVQRQEDRLVLIHRGQSGQLDLSYYRRGMLFPLRTIPAPGRDAGMAIVGRKLMVVTRTLEGALALRTIRLDTGTMQGPEVLRSQPLSNVTRLYLPLVLSVLVFGMMLFILLRPLGKNEAPSLPSIYVPADFSSRIVATLVDMAVPAVVALVIFQEGVRAIVASPLWTTDIVESLPLMLTATLTVLHAMVGEAMRGQSFGKRLLGLVVVDHQGSAPGLMQVLVRNLMKLVAIIMPPLLIFVLVNPLRQRLGDVIASTVVVRRVAHGESDTPRSE